ncbi:MAG: pilus assembly protein [Rhizobiales bacterium]|nr:pilus assembly protein [Hyphomicrobiales bacterium]
MPIQTVAVFFLVAVAIGGVVWVFVYPILSGERSVEKRMAGVARTGPVVRSAARGKEKSRREQVEETLKDIEARRKMNKRPSLQTRIAQAGLRLSKNQFLLASSGFGAAIFLVCLVGGAGLLPALGLGFAAGCGVPLWMVSFLKKRREARFLEVFPDAVDVIIRGIKSGLPLLDCLKIIAQDSEEPVRSEFRSLIDSQAIGLPLGDACARIYERIPLPEADFFAIVISIQQKAGGNLSEALGNLSRVLRDRKKMKAKIKAMSMEAKASAVIIASLPIAVMLLVYFSSPSYIELLWTHPTGRLMLAASAMWMGCGVLVMKKMINFDF